MTFSYKAFISYSQKDKIWAKWLQQQLETYEVPSKLNLDSSFPWEANELKTLHPVFRDETELPACNILSKEIEKYLDCSYTLIVLCSPSAVKSTWVNEEIRYFKKNYSDRRIIPVTLPVVADETNIPAEDICNLLYYPHELISRSNSLEMPLSAIFRNFSLPYEHIVDDKSKEVLHKIIAGILNVSLGELIDRERIYTQYKKALQSLPRVQEQLEQAYMSNDLSRALALSCISLKCKEILADQQGVEVGSFQIDVLRSILPKLYSFLHLADEAMVYNLNHNKCIIPIKSREELSVVNVPKGQVLETVFPEQTISYAEIDVSGGYLLMILNNTSLIVFKLPNITRPMGKYEVLGKSAYATISCQGDIAYVNSDGELWYIRGGEIRRLRVPAEAKESVGIWSYAKFSSDGRYVAAASYKSGGYVAVWEIVEDRADLCGSFPYKEDDLFTKPIEMYFSPDTTLFAVKYFKESYFVYKLPNLEKYDIQPLQSIKPEGIRFSADNTQILVNEGYCVSIFDIGTGQRYTQIPIQEDIINHFGYIEGTDWFYSVVGKTVKVWNKASTNAQLCFYLTLSKKVAAVFTNTTFLTAFTEDKTFITWDLQIMPICRRLTNFEKEARLSGFCGNGNYVYYTNNIHQMSLWEFAGEDLRLLSNNIEGCLEITSMSTGAFCREEGNNFSYIDFCNNEKREFGKLDIHFPLDRISVSSSGDSIAFARAVGNSGGIIYPKTGEIKNFTIPFSKGCTKLKFSHDEVYIALGDVAGGVTVYNTDSGEPYLIIPPSNREISGLAFSYDNCFLATCDRGGYVSIWNVPEKICVSIQKMEYQLRKVIFDQSGRYLATLDFEARHIALIDRDVPDNVVNLHVSKIWGHNVTFQSICFAWNGEILLVGFSNGVFTGWDTKSGKIVLPFINIDGYPISEINYFPGRPIFFRTNGGFYYLVCQQTSTSRNQIFAEAEFQGGYRLNLEGMMLEQLNRGDRIDKWDYLSKF